jgi:hypothetical protein
VAQRLTVTPEEAADRLAIRELIDAYARCADRRDAEGQMALFTENTRFLVFMDSRDPNPSQIIVGRANLKPVFDNLRQYEATTPSRPVPWEAAPNDWRRRSFLRRRDGLDLRPDGA